MDGIGYYPSADGVPPSIITNYSIYYKDTLIASPPTSGDATSWTFCRTSRTEPTTRLPPMWPLLPDFGATTASR